MTHHSQIPMNDANRIAALESQLGRIRAIADAAEPTKETIRIVRLCDDVLNGPAKHPRDKLATAR